MDNNDITVKTPSQEERCLQLARVLLAPRGYRRNKYGVEVTNGEIDRERVKQVGKIMNDLLIERDRIILAELDYQIDRLKDAKAEAETILGRMSWHHRKEKTKCRKVIYTYDQMILTYERCIKLVKVDTQPGAIYSVKADKLQGAVNPKEELSHCPTPNECLHPNCDCTNLRVNKD